MLPLNHLPEIVLDQLTSQQQNFAKVLLENKKNVFLTGTAGVGKSFLLNYLVQELQKLYSGKDEVYVAASTGIAASHINGTTIHSFAGIQLGTGTVEEICNRMHPDARRRWLQVRVPIIDEISIQFHAPTIKL